MPSIASLGLGPALVALFLSLGCSTPPAAPIASARDIAARTVTPPYYRIEGGGGASLLIMGTIHLGPIEGWRFSSALLRGLAEADSFILETDLRKATEAEVSTVLANRVVLPISVTIEDVVSPETAQLLEENDLLLSELGMPALARRRLKPWFLAVGMIEAASAQSGYSVEHSVENEILAGLGDRPLAGLETFDDQLALFDTLSPRHQDLMLRDTLSRLDETVEGIEDLIVAWGRNDGQALTQIAYQGVEEAPELEEFYDILLRERNLNWAIALARILEDPERDGETIFVAVGALHLVGSDSLIQKLELEGYPADALHPRADPRS